MIVPGHVTEVRLSHFQNAYSPTVVSLLGRFICVSFLHRENAYAPISLRESGSVIDFKFDEMSQKKLDLIEVLGREYVGLGVVAPGAFVKVVKEA